MTLHPPSAGTIAATEAGRKSAISRETNAAEINGGTCLHYNHRPPLHHGQEQYTAVPGRCCSDPCVYPHKLIPRHKERVKYDLCAANGITIPTYVWLSLSLDLGLRRDFAWRFVAADVTRPLIGVHFLSHFGLLVDRRHNCLLDGVTSLSVPAQAASSLIPCVKTISGGTLVDSLLTEFPDLTRPTGVQREVRHNTVQSHPKYIRPTGQLSTTTGTGPVRYRQRRVRRHVAGIREFLIFRPTHRAQEGK
jgi:hypothetical protein